MEAVKGFVFSRGTQILERKKVHSYLVSFVIMTEQPLSGLDPKGETVVMGINQFVNSLTDAIEQFNKYKAPYCLGDISNAIIKVSNLNPKDLEPINEQIKSPTPRKRRRN